MARYAELPTGITKNAEPKTGYTNRPPPPITQTEQVLTANLNQRMEAKKQVDGENMKMGYTPEQEQQFASLRNSRNRLYTEFNEGQWTADQVKQMDEKLTSRENSILPQPLKVPPSPQQQFELSLTKHPVTGQMGRILNNGKWEPLSGGMTAAERTSAYETAYKILTKIEKQGEATVEVPPDPNDVQAYVQQMETSGVESQGVISGQGQAPPGQAPPEELDRAAKIERMSQLRAKAAGKSS